MATEQDPASPKPLEDLAPGSSSDGFAISGTVLTVVSVLVAIMTLLKTWGFYKHLKRRRLRAGISRGNIGLIELGPHAPARGNILRSYYGENGARNVQINYYNATTNNIVVYPERRLSMVETAWLALYG